MTTHTSPWRRRITAACAALLILTGIVAVAFSIVGAYDRAAAFL